MTAATIALAAREWFGARAGVFAGIAYAVYGPAVFIDTAFLSEGLSLFLLSLVLLMLAREPVTSGRSIAAGAALGAAVLVRPTALLMAVACALWLLLSVSRLQPRAWALAGWLAAATVAVVSPALVQSWSTSRTLSIQGYGGVNFYIGNSPLHVGRGVFRLGGGWDALNTEAARAGIADPIAQDRYYVAKTWSEIRELPGAFVALLAKKALWVVQAEETRDSHSIYFFTDQSPILRVLPRMAILFPLACLGVVARPKRRPSDERGSGGSLLVYYAVAAAGGTVLLVIGMRYRMPLVPALVIAAGVGVDALVESLRSRRARDVSLYGVTVVIAIAVSHALSDPRNRNLSEEWAFTGSSLVTERNLNEAEAAYRHALELDPNSGLASDGLGLVQYDAGRLADARQQFARALALDPDNARAAFHLALTDEREGRIEDAIAGYRQALDRSPYDAEVTQHLGTALGMAGQLQEARVQMRRVVELTPNNGEAWLDLCLLSLDLHDVAAAADALQHARDWGAGPDRLAFAADALARARPGS